MSSKVRERERIWRVYVVGSDERIKEKHLRASLSLQWLQIHEKQLVLVMTTNTGCGDGSVDKVPMAQRGVLSSIASTHVRSWAQCL